MDRKTIFKSKTFWLNVVIALVPAFSSHAQERIAELGPQFTMIWGAINIVLRWVTKGGVKLLK